MPLPIKFNASVKSKLDDKEVLMKIQKAKKSTITSRGIIDIIEKIRQDVEEHLGEYREQYQLINTVEGLETYIAQANNFGKLAIDTETTGLDPIDDKIVGICLYFPGEKAAYVPIAHIDYITGALIPNQLTTEQIKPVFEKLTAKIIMHNAPFDIRVLINNIGVRTHCWWETQVGATLLNENEEHRLKPLHEKYISHKKEKTFAELFGQIKFNLIPIDLAYIYGAHDAIDTYELYEFQERFLNENEPRQDRRDMYWLYRNIEIPMVDVIVDLEENGVAIDLEYLTELKEKYHKKLDEALQHCYDVLEPYKDKIEAYRKSDLDNKLDNPISISSPTQLAILFYDILKAKPIKGLKKRSTDKNAMKEFAKDYEIARAIVDYRAFAKMTSTYIDNIFNIVKKDGRVHTHFNANGAKTGRMSSSDPLNLQNIPSHNEEIRKMFVGQTTYRDVEKRDDNAYILNRSEEVELQDGTWVWAEKVKSGDILESGEVVKVVKVKDFKVLIGV
jgi:DNA polymerase I-like protein with 3'-5' exonuclease and polymerase domains